MSSPFLVKNRRTFPAGQPILSQVIAVNRAAASLPATATETLFNVEGGRILLIALIGEVTTAIQNQACTAAIAVDGDVGAADDLASAVSIQALALGNTLSVEGDGTAGITTGIAWGQACTTPVVISPGIITLTTSATNTGEMKWSLYYMPLDPGAYVTT